MAIFKWNECRVCLFHLSFISIFFPFDKFESDATLATTSHCMAVSVQRNNADKALGLFFYTKLCIFSFHLAYYQAESWQGVAFTLLAQMKSYLVKDDLQRCELVEGNQQRMLRHPGAGHSRTLLPPSGPKGQGEKMVVSETREGCGLRGALPAGSLDPGGAETRREWRHIRASPFSHPSISCWCLP